MKSAAIENPRERQEELGQFLTATPVADFMASMFGPLPRATRRAPRVRWGLLVKAIIEVFCARWAPGAVILGVRDTKNNHLVRSAKPEATIRMKLQRLNFNP